MIGSKKWIDLIRWHSLVRSVNDEEFEYSQFEAFFFILVSLRKTRQCICSPLYLALTIINPKMIPKELLGLTDLPEAQTLRINEAA